MSDESTRNVFEQSMDEVFPVTIYEDGQRVDIGTGRIVYTDDSGIHIEFEYNGKLHQGLVPPKPLPKTTYHRPEGHKPEGNFGFPKPPRAIYEENMYENHKEP